MLDCLYFHTENTLTYAQHSLETIGYETTFHPILRLQNNNQEKTRSFCYPRGFFVALNLRRVLLNDELVNRREVSVLDE